MNYVGTCGTVMSNPHYGINQEPSEWQRRLHHRACEVLYGIEHVIAGMFCDAVWTDIKVTPGGGATARHKVRWWNPASWAGWFRTIVLKDRCGSAYYRKG